MKNIWLSIVGLLIFNSLSAQQVNVIPYPAEVKLAKGHLSLAADVKFTTNNKNFSTLLKYINSETSNRNTGKQQPVTLRISTELKTAGSYRLSTTGNSIKITAADKDGLFNGLVTLLQLYKTSPVQSGQILLPVLDIADTPRYPWRGFMLDESRHFFGKETVKQLLDWMAFYKLNRFHWHLTDSQGWRVEVKKYPLLTSTGSKGNFTDSAAAPRYYTQKDIREIVAYAKDRNIIIIPEVDMPGHATAATKAYPELSGGFTPNYPGFTFNPAKPETYTFLSNVIKELLQLFPDHLFHIGGDEVALGIKAWDNNADIKAMMQQMNFKDLSQVEFAFLRRVADSVYKSNATALCWDEAVSAGLPTNKTIVTWWRHNKPETLAQALNNGYQVILCPRLPMYFDFVQDSTHRSGRKWVGRYNTYLDVYHYPEQELSAETIANTKIIGLQANLWTETVITEKRLQYLTFPRIAGLAEAGWTSGITKNDTSFNERLKRHLFLYGKNNVYYYDPFNPTKNPEPIDVPVKPETKD